MSTYKLRIVCNSAERQWTHDYEPGVAKTEETAPAWAAAMQKLLGRDYACTLLCDGEPVDLSGKPKTPADLFGGVT